MALLNGYTGQVGYTGPDNKVILEAPKNSYTNYSFTGSDLIAHTVYVDTSTERYCHVGMTYAAALLCQTAQMTAWTVDGKCSASCSVTPQGGHMYQCETSVLLVQNTIVDT